MIGLPGRNQTHSVTQETKETKEGWPEVGEKRTRDGIAKEKLSRRGEKTNSQGKKAR
jgi:hypothetical protein